MACCTFSHSELYHNDVLFYCRFIKFRLDLWCAGLGDSEFRCSAMSSRSFVVIRFKRVGPTVAFTAWSEWRYYGNVILVYSGVYVGDWTDRGTKMYVSAYIL